MSISRLSPLIVPPIHLWCTLPVWSSPPSIQGKGASLMPKTPRPTTGAWRPPEQVGIPLFVQANAVCSNHSSKVTLEHLDPYSTHRHCLSARHHVRCRPHPHSLPPALPAVFSAPLPLLSVHTLNCPEGAVLRRWCLEWCHLTEFASTCLT